MTKHTEGPWESIIHKQGKIYTYSGDEALAEIFETEGGESQANANLIAAAPELLEALKACHDVLLTSKYHEGRAIKMAAAALDKAEGK